MTRVASLGKSPEPYAASKGKHGQEEDEGVLIGAPCERHPRGSGTKAGRQSRQKRHPVRHVPTVAPRSWKRRVGALIAYRRIDGKTDEKGRYITLGSSLAEANCSPAANASCRAQPRWCTLTA